MGKCKQDKRWTSPLCWRSGEDPRKQIVSESEWFSQQGKQQIPDRGKNKHKLFCFLLNRVIQLTTSDAVTHSVLSVLLPTLSPHKIAPFHSWWDYWRVNSRTNYETKKPSTPALCLLHWHLWPWEALQGLITFWQQGWNIDSSVRATECITSRT